MSIRTLRADEPVPDSPPARYIEGRGYARVRWAIGDGEYVEEYEHRIVMGRPDGEVHHRNGNKADNRPENLEVLTKSGHAHVHGAAARGNRKYGPHRSREAMEKAQKAEARRFAYRARALEMKRLYDAGVSTPAIAEVFGVSAATANASLQAIGVQMKNAGNAYLPPIDRDEVRRLHAAGIRAGAMCERFGVGRRRLYQVFDELGLPRFGPGAPQGPPRGGLRDEASRTGAAA